MQYLNLLNFNSSCLNKVFLLSLNTKYEIQNYKILDGLTYN